ncbi:beta-ketoacyl-ACP synthase [Pseudoalteromonas sp. G4]|uniref:beta-ketoacyl-ACP synthase n=1 Tax=Pseudoalteromonas sp. G4 TaxID=2992761 RepID=UPI00237D8169|nr:beta-ketoacyl-ACP synthase [Pseudoalteromonas sp. G4]MDE3271996.1 beta-ketoacyl-ACP synthase [Pseudoalteromonas sp. G4]
MAVALNDLGLICSLGNNKESVMAALCDPKLSQQNVLSPFAKTGNDGTAFLVGAVKAELPEIADSFFNTRNNQLLLSAYLQIEKTFKALCKDVAKSRIAIVLGTSTSAISEGESAYKVFSDTGKYPDQFDYRQQELHAPSEFLAHITGAKGPCYTISTACSSSGKALVSAKGLLQSGIADIVLCGGVDSLCEMTLNGFKALESTAERYCKPFNAGRDGINIGEAAALFVMTKESSKAHSAIQLLGAGESSDAYHVSAPEPSGRGAIASMSKALTDAGLNATDIDYINAHGTGTPKNDEMEANAINALGFDCMVSSTKALTGHTLGAAGALEAGLCWLLLSDLNSENMLPENHPSAELDEKLAAIKLAAGQTSGKIGRCLSNSFAFGGNNVSLIFGK